MKSEEMQWRMGMRGSMKVGVEEEEEWNDGEIGWGDKKKSCFPSLSSTVLLLLLLFLPRVRPPQ